MSGLQHAALIDSLRRLIERLTWRPDRTAWADYADRTSYVDVAASSKDAIVRQLLERSKGNVVWDLGANVGRFSAVAAAVGRTVIAWDADPGATELHYLRVRESKTRTVLPLLGDLVNPSPRLGWAGVERRSFVDRANADVILALALVHHLNISRTIRLAMIADLFASLGRTLIVEFVPEGDPMVQRLLAQHDDRQPYPTLEEFRRVFAGRYTVDEEAKIEGSERVLIRMTRRA